MDKFFTVLKENGLILLFNYRRKISTSDEVKKHPAF